MPNIPKDPLSLHNLQWMLRHSFDASTEEKNQLKTLLGCKEEASWTEVQEAINLHIKKLQAENKDEPTNSAGKSLGDDQASATIGQSIQGLPLNTVAKLIGLSDSTVKKELLKMRDKKIADETTRLGSEEAALNLVNGTYINLSIAGKHKRLLVSPEALADLQKIFVSGLLLQQESATMSNLAWHSPTILGSNYTRRLESLFITTIKGINSTTPAEGEMRDIINAKLFHKEIKSNGTPGAWRISTVFVGMAFDKDTPITRNNISLISGPELLERAKRLIKAIKQSGGKAQLEFYEERGNELTQQPPFFGTAVAHRRTR